MSKTTLASALAACLALALPLMASAGSGHGDEAGEGHSGDHGSATPAPASLTSAWTTLMAARDAIAGDVESGALGEVHAKAEPLPKLVAALLEQSRDLDPGKRTRVEGAAKQVTRVADALHEAADRGDEARTRKELSRLDGLLKLIRAQYPAGALDASPVMKATPPHPGRSTERTRAWSGRRALSTLPLRRAFVSRRLTCFASSRNASKYRPGYRLASCLRTWEPPTTRSS